MDLTHRWCHSFSMDFRNESPFLDPFLTRVYRGCRGGDKVETGVIKVTIFGLRMGLG